MRTTALKRLSLLPISKGEGISAQRKVAFLSELANIGVRLTNPELLDQASENFFLHYNECIATLREMRGGNVDYVPLFVDFPDKLPDDSEYFAKRVLGHLGNALGLLDGESLESGAKIPSWLFELKEFGADPISQMQDKGLWQKTKERLSCRKGDSHVEWTEVRLCWEEECLDALRTWMQQCLSAKSSVKEAWREEVKELLLHFGAEAIEFDAVSFKENRALVLLALWQAGREKEACQLASTATDLLRLFAALTESDVSLSAKVRFPKFSRKQRKLVLAALNDCASLAEDLRAYKGLWLELGRYLHPGEYAKRFPKAGAAFHALRNGKIHTFAGRVEAAMRAENLGKTLSLLRSRPGVLARKLHELLRRFPQEQAEVLVAFREVSEIISVKNLLVLRSYFQSINQSEYRTVVNKAGKIKVVENNAKEALSERCLGKLDLLLEDAILRSLGEKESWEGKKVWVDSSLANYTVPLQQRAASDGLLTFGRGSRVSVDFSKVLRLFVYWKQADKRTDLDLSVIQFKEDWSYAGHVSYTRLSSDGIAHSGDIQSAPHGAAEFIDITLSKIPEGVRYLATQVYLYSGNAFADMLCHSGWMFREKVNAQYNSFDIKTVANRFALKGRGAYALPLIVDLKTGEIIITDLYISGAVMHNNVEASYGNVSQVCREISGFTRSRPTMDELARLHLRARGATLCEKEDADIRFGLKDCTYNVNQVEKVLSELL